MEMTTLPLHDASEKCRAMKEQDDERMDALAAIALSSAAIQAALISHLKTIGLLGDQDVHEIYERALLMLETADTSAESKQIFGAARELIEEHLRLKK